jgi:hypothetical protein
LLDWQLDIIVHNGCLSSLHPHLSTLHLLKVLLNNIPFPEAPGTIYTKSGNDYEADEYCKAFIHLETLFFPRL